MKRLKKIVLVFVIIILAIFQNLIETKAYTEEEYKEIIEYQEYDKDDEQNEDDYDVVVNYRELIENPGIPVIQTGVDDILYGDDEMLNIDFFNVGNKKISDETWNKYKEIVLNFYRLSLFIGAAILLTFLIYIAIIIVSSSISSNNNLMPLGKKILNANTDTSGQKNPKKSLMERRIIEQWIVTVLILALITPMVTLMISFSNVLGNAMKSYNMGDKKDEKISVYVKNAKGKEKSTNTPVSSNNDDLQSAVQNYINGEATKGNWAIYAKNLDEDIAEVDINIYNQMPSASVIKLFIAAAVYEKFGVQSGYENNIKSMISKSDNNATNELIKALGNGELEKGFNAVNKYCSDNSYESTSLRRTFGDRQGYTAEEDNYTSAENVGRILEEIYKGTCVSKKASEKLMNYLKEQVHRNKIPSGVDGGVIVANKTGELPAGPSTYANGPIENDAAIVFKDGAKYILVALSSNLENDAGGINSIVEISKKVYDGIGEGNSLRNKSIKKVEYINYSFKTNIEGLLMFKSQYNWNKYAGQNAINLGCGILIIAYKFWYYIEFLVRTFLIGLLIAVAPIIVLISGIRKAIGNKGILSGWVKIFSYCILIKPLVGIVYYIIAKTNLKLTVDNPYLIIIAMLATLILERTLFNLLKGSLKNNDGSREKIGN